MSLRLRLFLLFGTLVALLMGAQWLMIRSLSRDLSSEVKGMAFKVSSAVISVIQEEHEDSTHHEMEVFLDKAEGPAQVRILHTSEADGGAILERHLKWKNAQEIHPLDTSGRRDSEQKLTEGKPRSKAPNGRETPAVASQGGDQQEGDSGDESESKKPRIFKQVLRPSDSKVLNLEPKTLANAARIAARFEAQEADDVLIIKSPQIEHRIPIPRETFDSRVARFSNRLLVGSALLLAVGLLLAALLAHRVTQPLHQLSLAAKQVGEGAFGIQVDASAGGEVGATLASFNSMSAHLERLEKDTQRLRAGQQLSELGEISRGLAHSLRNPLNALGLSVDSLATSGVGDHGRSKLAAGARQQIRRMDRSLRSFLALASSGGAPDEVDVAAVLQDVVLEALQNEVGQKGDEELPRTSIEARPQPGLAPLRAVAPELRAVLQALVVNAVEASPPGGQVRVAAENSSQGQLRITVEDEGPGLPKSIRQRLFTPHLTTKPQGSGMGLFLAHRIAVNRYDGRLELEDIFAEETDEAGTSSKRAVPVGTRAILTLGPRRSLDAEGDQYV